MDVFAEGARTEKTGGAMIQDRSLAETDGKDPILRERRDAGLFHSLDGINLSVGGGWVTGVDVHGDDLLTVVDDTQVEVVVLVDSAFIHLTNVQGIQETDIGGCENDMPRPVVLR